MNFEQDAANFRGRLQQVANWIADYYEQLESLPVKSPLQPGEVFGRLPGAPPAQGESFDRIMGDFAQVILPGMTHWQHPHFHAYFPANASQASILAEMLTAAMGAQCMIWDTSPAAAELEEMMMEWLKELCGLPAHWQGAIQDTASTATLCALLSARERASGFEVNEAGFDGWTQFRVYASAETHSSIEKAVKIAGFGRRNLRQIETDESLAMSPAALEAAIRSDLEAGHKPLCVVATLGTTGTTACDPIRPLAEICARYGLWLHVDAAFAGTALALPEYRYLADGLQEADSYVFNPHKWMFVNFDCSAYFVRDPELLVRTFEILPEYLKTQARGVRNYRDWGIPLGRRFRALKLWFVLRSYGQEGIRETLRNHIRWAASFAENVRQSADFELITEPLFNLVCFRYKPGGLPETALDALNAQLLSQLNASGKLYLSHTRVRGVFTIRFVAGNTRLSEKHVSEAWEWISEAARALPRA